MVSIPRFISGNIVTIGVVLAGVALFFGLGGAQGIGAKLGGGFKSFGSSFVGGIGGAFGEAFGETPASESQPLSPPSSLTGQAPEIGLPQLADSLKQQQGTLQGINNFFSNLFSGAVFNPQALTLPPLFTQQAIQKRIEQSIGGINQPSNVGGTPFGGFKTADLQEIALQEAIIQSKLDNPSFFLV